MGRVAASTFRYSDTGKHVSERAEPERFYHGFVLGLMVDLADRYCITSNRESGFGRYDIIQSHLTERAALSQIDEKNYAASLRTKGFLPEQIKKYGFAFQGKKVLIG